MSDNIVNFNKAKKAKARHRQVIKAAENRAKFGQKKTQKEKTKALAQKLQKKLDGHKIDKPKSDD